MFKQNKIQDIMKKTYIIPEADVIEIKVTQMLTASLTVIDPTDPANDLDEGDILSREDDFEEDDFDMGEEDI